MATFLLFLVGVIFPDRTIFANPIQDSPKKSHFCYSHEQKIVRYDMKRAFGLLKSTFDTMRREQKWWSLHEVVQISGGCMTLHNIIVQLSGRGEFWWRVEWCKHRNRTSRKRIDAISGFKCGGKMRHTRCAGVLGPGRAWHWYTERTLVCRSNQSCMLQGVQIWFGIQHYWWLRPPFVIISVPWRGKQVFGHTILFSWCHGQ